MSRFFIFFASVFLFSVLSSNAYGARMITYDDESWFVEEYNTFNFEVNSTIKVKHFNYGPESKTLPGKSQIRINNKCGISHYDENRNIIRHFDGNTFDLLRTITIPEFKTNKKLEDVTVRKFIFSKSTCGYIYLVDTPLRSSYSDEQRRKLTIWFFDGLKSVDHVIKYDVNCHGYDEDGQCIKKDRYFGPYFNSTGSGYYMIDYKIKDSVYKIIEYKMKTSKTMERKTLYSWNDKYCSTNIFDGCQNGNVKFQVIEGKLNTYDYFTLGDVHNLDSENTINIFRIENGRFKKEPKRVSDKMLAPYYSKFKKPYLYLSGVEDMDAEPNKFSAELYYVGPKKLRLFNEWQYMGNENFKFDVMPLGYAMSKDKRFVAATVKYSTVFDGENESYIKGDVTGKAISAVKNYRVTSRKFPAVFIYDTNLRRPLRNKLYNNVLIGWLSAKRLLMKNSKDGVVVFDLSTGKTDKIGINSFDGKQLFLF